MTVHSLLTPEQNSFLSAEREIIQDLLETLSNWETPRTELEHLRQALNQLNELFLLVFLGEFNSGKSALINALLGETYLKEGVTPTTDRIHILKYGQTGEPEYESEDVRVLRFPAEMLREIHIVDTPGTNAVLRKHEAISREFVPRSDMVIFVTSADRPFTESERNFLEVIREWGKKVVFVINKIDLLPNPEALNEVHEFVRTNVQDSLGFKPKLFTLSAKQDDDNMEGMSTLDGRWQGQNAFKEYLTSILTKEELIRLKFLSPLGVAIKIAKENEIRAADRNQVLHDDVITLENVEQHLALYESDTQQEFDSHLLSVENELLEMRLRGEEFLDDRLRLLNIRNMLRSDQLQRDFQEIVVGDTPGGIGREIQEIIDWIVEREIRQWRLMAEELGKRTETETLRTAAKKASDGFEYNRRELLESLGVQAERVVKKYDQRAESERLSALVQESIALVGLVEVSAIGLGFILKAVLTTAVADATGVLAAGILGVLGFAVIPYRRGVAKKQLREKLTKLQSDLRNTLRRDFERELKKSLTRLRESLAPYRRFVLSEKDSVDMVLSRIKQHHSMMHKMKTSLEESNTQDPR